MIRGYLAALCLAAPALAQADLDTARKQIEREQLEAARSTLQEHIRSHPADREARLLLGRVAAWELDTATALELFDGLLREDQDNADYLLAKGQALLWDGRPQEAIGPLQRAAELAPAYAEVQDALRQARSSVIDTADGASASVRTPVVARREVELSTRRDWLSGDFADWQSQRLNYSSVQPTGAGWYGAILSEERFKERDQGVEFGALLPLNGGWLLQPEVGYQPSPFFLPEWHADLRLQRVLSGGFITSGSVRRTQYQATRVDRLALSTERYWGSWRAGYTLNISDVANAGTPVGHNFALDHFYQGLSYAGLRLTAGDEEAVEGQQVITSSVVAASLQGRHWFQPQWAVFWELGHHRQGSFYERNWLQLGLRHAF